jgi:hypothetical protein
MWRKISDLRLEITDPKISSLFLKLDTYLSYPTIGKSTTCHSDWLFAVCQEIPD